MTDEQYNVLCDLRAIPQRLSHFHLLRRDAAKTARELVKLGLVVESNCDDYEPGTVGFRLNKPGRQALYAEWQRRGRPDPAKSEVTR